MKKCKKCKNYDNCRKFHEFEPIETCKRYRFDFMPIAIASALFLAFATCASGCGLLIWNAVSLHQAEFAEQMEKFGFYKNDICLNYGRSVAENASIWGSIGCGIGAILFGGFFVSVIFS